MDKFAKLLSYVTFIRVSRRAGSALFATDNLLRRGKFSLSLVGFDTSLSACCIEARGIVQVESGGPRPVVVAACPIVCRGTGIGAVLVGSTQPLCSREQEAVSMLADALAGVLDDMTLSETMVELLACRERDQSFCGMEMEFQDLPFVPQSLKLLPNDIQTNTYRDDDERERDEYRGGGGESGESGSKSGGESGSGIKSGGESKSGRSGSNNDRKGGDTVDGCAKCAQHECRGKGAKDVGTTTKPLGLPDEFNIRIFGLSWLYLSSVVVAKLFAPAGSVSMSAMVVAVLALVSGVGSMALLFPGLLATKIVARVDRFVKQASIYNGTSLSAATVVAATNALTHSDP